LKIPASDRLSMTSWKGAKYGIVNENGMIRKSGNRFSDEIMPKK
jgi:hypothetical protein